MFVPMGRFTREFLRQNMFGRSKGFATVRPPDPQITALWQAAKERQNAKRERRRGRKTQRNSREGERLRRENQRARHESAKKELEKCL